MRNKYLVMNFKGYKKSDVDAIIIQLEAACQRTGLSRVDIASKLKTSSQSIDNAFATTYSKRDNEITFKASDKLVCDIAKTLGIKLAIVETGTKQYFINLKK